MRCSNAIPVRVIGPIAAAILAVAGCTPPTLDGVVGTTVTSSVAMNGWAVNYPKQRKLFYAAGLYWLFYSDGVDAVYRTSADAISWSDPTLVAVDSVYGHRMGVRFDGDRVHYAHARAYNSDDVWYRAGVAEADGTIAWLAPEQVAFDIVDGDNAMYPDVVVDGSGAPWVTFMRHTGPLHDGPWDSVLTRSDGAPGVWVTAPGFPFNLVAGTTTSYPHAVGAALADGSVYWLYNVELREPYQGRLWRDGCWSDAEQVSDGNHSHGHYNIVADGDVIHVAFGAGSVHYRRRDPIDGWGATRKLGDGSGHSLVTLVAPDRVAVTWLAPVRKRVLLATAGPDGIDGPWTLAREGDGFGDPDLSINLNGLVTASPDYDLAVVYSTGFSPTYDVELVAVDTLP